MSVLACVEASAMASGTILYCVVPAAPRATDGLCCFSMGRDRTCRESYDCVRHGGCSESMVPVLATPATRGALCCPRSGPGRLRMGVQRIWIRQCGEAGLWFSN